MIILLKGDIFTPNTAGLLQNSSHCTLRLCRGGATVLKVGGTILGAERAKKNFWPPP